MAGLTPEGGPGDHSTEGRRGSTSALIPDIDIWRCAGVMIKRYGDQADIEAAARADEHEKEGERDRQRVWLRILRAIDALQKVQSAETRH